jgi:adenine-specific DNA-methyltransferase
MTNLVAGTPPEQQAGTSKQLGTLIDLLKKLFQLDQPDLDFGLYRIMHAKADEIGQFLEKDLLPQVKDAFSRYTTADKAELREQLAKAIDQANNLGVDPEATAKVRELRQRIATEGVDIAGLETEVYDHLYSFFRRYYDEGDFLARRVYKPGVYAIPYEGEEIKLHWANRDQYYIKTTEYLRDYAFTLRPWAATDSMRVHFRLVDAAEGEHGNIKAVEGKERVFVLAADNFAAIENGELVLNFQYRPATMGDWPAGARRTATAAAGKKPPVQKELLVDAVERVLAVDQPALKIWIDELSKKHVKANGETADYSRLEGHLNRYVARHTFDYFIHKDLGGFLRRELDFFIKNEVMHLDDVESESAPRVDQYLSKLKVLRRIANKLIDFLAQLETFQKKLWLKRKLVVETHYCVTLDRIPESFYAEIAANEKQRQEWKRLFSLDAIAPTAPIDSVDAASDSVAFLKEHRTLVVDTAHFTPDFTARLLSTIEDLDSTLDGVLIHGDNFHALRLLDKRFASAVKCAYIDPPYNTDASAIPYKNDYRHSSWCTMIRDRVDIASTLLKDDGAIFVSIDKTERTVLEHVLDDVFGSNNHIEELIWTQATANSQLPNYSTNHEYVEVYAKDRASVERDAEMFREPKPGYAEVMALLERLRPEYPPLREIESSIKSLYKEHENSYKDEWEASGQEWDADARRQNPWRGIYPYNRAEYRDANGRLVPESEAKNVDAAIWVWSEISAAAPASKQSPTTKDPNHFNYRYYKPLHPVTGKACQHPRSGWKFPFKADPNNPSRRSFEEFEKDHRIAWGDDEQKLPRTKGFLHEVETNIGTSVFYAYNDGESELTDMFGEAGLFLSPKSSRFVRKFITQATRKTDWFLDFFGGSGSSGHAVIAQNREDGGTRKQVIVEVGAHFDTILLPRIKKVSYASTWRGGKPSKADGGSQMFKYIRLESYEDALNNLDMRRTTAQASLLDMSEAASNDGLKEAYLLRYMLDVETRGSQSLLNIAAFNDPTAYRLNVKPTGSDKSREVNVDLLETFNYLIGLTVKHIAAPQSFHAAFTRDQERRLVLNGSLKQDDAGSWWFRTVDGTMPDGRKALVIWRKLTGDAEQDNLVLDAWLDIWLKERGYSTKDYDLIFVNGDNNLENLQKADDTWKVRLIEEDFHRLMFDVESL